MKGEQESIKFVYTKTGTGFIVGSDKVVWAKRPFKDKFVRFHTLPDSLAFSNFVEQIKKRDQGECLIGVQPPNSEDLGGMLAELHNEGITDALDGCAIELDGKCPHGYPSWLSIAGYS